MKYLLIIPIIVIVAVGIIVIRQHKDTSASQSPPAEQGITYLPLGDSYTIGQSVKTSDRWPNQLVAALAQQNKKLTIVANPSVTGYTSQNLIDRELPLVAKYQPQFVTVQIGVNDYVQGIDEQTFQVNLEKIISMLQAKLRRPGNILLVTIPDYAKTPTGAQFGDPVAATQAIAARNEIIQQIATAHKLPVADVFAASQGVTADPSLIASDGLHPSGKQYAAWTSIILAAMQAGNLPQD